MSARTSLAAFALLVFAAAADAPAQAPRMDPMSMVPGPHMVTSVADANRLPPNVMPVASDAAFVDRSHHPDRFPFAVSGYNPMLYGPNGLLNPYGTSPFGYYGTGGPYQQYNMSTSAYYDPSAAAASSPISTSLSKNRSFDPNASATLNGLNAPSRPTSKATKSRKSARKKK